MFDIEKQNDIQKRISQVIPSDVILSKGAFFTDIHFGKKSNDETHNQDCLNFIEFFCKEVEKDSTIDYVAFLGDWHENRSSLNLSTMNYSYEGIKRLNRLGLPIFFIVGNHDLYHRNNRQIHSLPFFNELKNVIVIDEPVVVNQIKNGAVFSPFIFDSEYAGLKTMQEFLKIPVWLGHFEFSGFYITGTNVIMDSGPSTSGFEKVLRIFSGHFHKRQHLHNVTYIGNTFPMDFSDAGDNERGMAIYNHADNSLTFKNWVDCPKYQRVYLTELMTSKVDIWNGATVKCICDIVINHEESIAIKDHYMKEFNLRDFLLEEEESMTKTISETEVSFDWEENEATTIDDAVKQMIRQITNEKINIDLLIECYEKLPKDV